MTARSDLQWIELDAAALRHNVKAFRSMLGASTTLLPVVKANAYGHGMVEIARALRGEKLWGLAVAGGGEAVALQQANIQTNILVLSYYTPRDLLRLRFSKNVAVVVSNVGQLALLRSFARKRGVRRRVHLKIDTGTSRIGFLPSELTSLVRALNKLPEGIRIEGVFSHLAEAESARQAFTRFQAAAFTKACGFLEHALKKKLIKHIACSAAILMVRSTHGDIARLGIGMYGIWPSRAVERFAARHHPDMRLRPVLQWKTRLLEVKCVPRGTAIGYGRAFQAKRRLRYGVVPVGYADGYFRSLSNKGTVIVRGHLCRVLGRVCMNLMMIDLTNVSSAATGDDVVLIGSQGKETVAANVLAEHAGTISYELLSRLSAHIPRYTV